MHMQVKDANIKTRMEDANIKTRMEGNDTIASLHILSVSFLEAIEGW